MVNLSGFFVVAVFLWRFRLRVDCKTVVFGRIRKAGSAVSVILECEAREPHSLQTFRSNMVRRSRSQKIRLFCSLDYE